MAVDYDVLELQLEGTAQMLSEARREIKTLRAENQRLQAIERRAQNFADFLLNEQSRETARVILNGGS